MVIIKYYEWLKIQELLMEKAGLKPDIREAVYELCNDDFKKIRQIDKQEAIELIEENHLMMVHRNKYGAIWR